MSKKFNIPPYFKAKKRGLIPDEIAETKSEEKESSLFSISYAFYNDNMCEIHCLEKNCSRETLRVLRVIGKSKSVKDLDSYGIDRKDVREDGAYKKLFGGLPEFTKLYEHKLQSTARLFYFVSQKFINIVSITNSHLETDKVRR